MKFSDLGKKTKPATLDLGDGDAIHFEFRPDQITPRFVQGLIALDESRLKSATASEADATVRGIPEMVARVVASWDVTEADGTTMFPLDAARLAAEIPLSVQVGILFRCMTEMQPGEVTAPQTPSRAGSFATTK